MADDRNITILQKVGDQFAHGIAGSREGPPLQHHFSGKVVHGTNPEHPLVHMVCWSQMEPVKVDVKAHVVLAGNREAPVVVKMGHHFENPHVLEHRFASKLTEPIHHALQMRTPLQLRFCNPWNLASDYAVEVRMGDQPLMSIRISGATVATPEPCKNDDWPPVAVQPSLPRSGEL